nr:ATP-binding protein [Vibrio cholerae]
VSNIISIIDDNKKTMDIKREKLTSFMDTVNEFFSYTGKKIVITNLGRVFVVVNKKHKVDLERLSSGEMQLISIISNMIFCKNNNRGLVVIIDEPEISLHVKWQEIFIEVLQNIKKDAQLVLATH